MAKNPTTVPEDPAAASPVFAFAAGLFFFIAIIKFGNPVVLDPYIEAPQNLASAFYNGWPILWGEWLFVPVVVAGLFALRLNRAKLHWVVFLPLIWLGWQFVSATQTVGPALTKLTLAHFSICVSLLYLGLFARKGMSNAWPVWAGIGLALCWVLRAGLEQHFGGLEATRRLVANSPELTGLDPALLANADYQKRILSNRIFGTFGGYPNSLAAAIVLFLPLTLVFLWRVTPKVRYSIRIAFVLILGVCGLGCLYWSGSKAGWLVALAVGLAALGHSPLGLKWRRGLIYGVLCLGVACFGFKYAGFFQKEHNSVEARFGYWRAAMVVIRHHPWLGSGPGTFQIPYERIKRPADEMTRLCHNDYLEQASDSGVFGFVSYVGMVFTLLYVLYRYSIRKMPLDWLELGGWLGILGISLHSLVDFNLYVPALAWPLFFLCGWLFQRDR